MLALFLKEKTLEECKRQKKREKFGFGWYKKKIDRSFSGINRWDGSVSLFVNSHFDP
jgi:hypothetical protein